MAIIDFLKKRKTEPEKKETIEEKKEKESLEKKEEKISIKPKQKTKKIKEEKSDIAWRVLKAPQITEKATKLAEENQYVFKILPKANKTEVKKAIEQLYGVDVIGVKIINVKSKKRRLGRILGERSGYKKAIVRIKEGQKIELLPR